MILIYTLKATGLLAVTAVAELWASGDCLVAMLALPMLLAMWYATRLRARRRALGSGRT